MGGEDLLIGQHNLFSAGNREDDLYFIHKIFNIKFVSQSKEDLYILGSELEARFQSLDADS